MENHQRSFAGKSNTPHTRQVALSGQPVRVLQGRTQRVDMDSTQKLSIRWVCTFSLKTEILKSSGSSATSLRSFVKKKVGCKPDFDTVEEWVQTMSGRISYPGDFYVHCVDLLREEKIWPKAIRYSILGNNWSRYADTYTAAELIVHDRILLLSYNQESRAYRRARVDCWRSPKKPIEINDWGSSEDSW